MRFIFVITGLAFWALYFFSYLFFGGMFIGGILDPLLGSPQPLWSMYVRLAVLLVGAILFHKLISRLIPGASGYFRFWKELVGNSEGSYRKSYEEFGRAATLSYLGAALMFVTGIAFALYTVE